jgi:DNA-binding beta-propeller fold protein YncE
MKRTLISTVIILTACLSLALAQNEKKGYRFYQRQAIEAYQNQDLNGFIDNTEKALEYNPHSSAMMYNLACGYALTDKVDTSLAILKKLAQMGIDYGVADDPDLEAVRQSSGYNQLLDIYDETLKPINTSTILHTFPQLDLLPEGIAVDPKSGRMFFGSMRYGTIYEAFDGGLLRFAELKNDIPLACLGMKVDPVRNILWAVGSSFDYVEGFEEEDYGTSGVFGFDLNMGEIIRKVVFPNNDPNFRLNDLAVSSNGDIYLSGAGAYVLRKGANMIDTLISSGKMMGSNGITLSTDENILFVSDYAGGIAAVNLSDKSLTDIKIPNCISIYGIDGMYYYNGSLIAIQNSFNPWRISRFYLNGDLTAIDSMIILEQKNPDASEAFTGTISGTDFIYIAHGNQPVEMPDYIPPHIRRDIGPTIIMQTSLK